MRFYSAPFDTILIRFYLMMAFAIVPFFIGLPYLAILSVPFFLSAITGIEFNSEKDSKNKTENTLTTKVSNLGSKQAA